MLTDGVPVLLLLLHEGGWDEVLMVAVGLGIAYFVIVWSGRRNRDGDDEDDEDDEGEDVEDVEDVDDAPMPRSAQAKAVPPPSNRD